VEDSFKLLEERIHKAVRRLQELSDEAKALRAELGQAKARADKAEKALAEAVASRGAEAVEAEKREAVARELTTLKRERAEIRARVAKLVGILEGL
jgi:predicted  nucleic acid-binding Zn-ribbon protein